MLQGIEKRGVNVCIVELLYIVGPSEIFECLKQEYFYNSSKYKSLCSNENLLQVIEKFKEFVNEVEKL